MIELVKDNPIYSVHVEYAMQYLGSFMGERDHAGQNDHRYEAYVDFDSSGDYSYQWGPYLHWYHQNDASICLQITNSPQRANYNLNRFNAPIYIALREYVLENWWTIISRKPLLDKGRLSMCIEPFRHWRDT